MESNPLTPPFDRQRCVPNIRHATSPCIGRNTQPFENFPMSLAGFDDLTVSVGKKILAKLEGLLRPTRIGEHILVGCDPNDGRKSQRRHTKSGITGKDRCEPAAADRVPRRIGPKGIDERVYVRQDHSERFMRSTYSRSSSSCTNEDRSSQLIPDLRPPLALLTGGSLCFADLGLLLWETTSLKPCSINDVSVRPSAAAFRLARCRSSSGNRTVVRSLIRLRCVMEFDMSICHFLASGQ